MGAFDIVKRILRMLAILLMIVPIVLTAVFIAETEPFSLKFFHIDDFGCVLLSVVFGILIPIITIVFSIRRVRKNRGIMLLFIAAVLSAAIGIPTAMLMTVGDSICSYTDDVGDYGIYDDYATECIAFYNGKDLLPSDDSFELREYRYRYVANNDCFYAYSEICFDSRLDYDAQLERLNSYDVGYDGTYDCKVSSADETEQLALIWKASPDEQSITMLLIYDHYHSGYDRMMELQGADDLFAVKDD